MRQSIHLLPGKTAHLAFHATPAPPADRKKRMKHFKFTEKRWQLREQILEAATEPLTLPELREAVGAEANEFKGISAQMTRDGELLRVGAKSLRSNELRYVVVELEDADPDEALAWLAASTCARSGRSAPRTSSGGRGRCRRAKQALAAHETEELDGGLLIRPQDVKPFEKAKPPKNAVDLLPKWDSYTMGYAPDGRDRFAHPDVVKQCYDFRGDGRPVILVDGQAAGTWEKGEPTVRQGPGEDAARRSTSASPPSRRSWATGPPLDLRHARPASRASRSTAQAPRRALGRARARRTANRTPRGVHNRFGSRTSNRPSPTRAAFSAMSPPAGETTTRQPAASASIGVPCPPCVTTTSHAGIVFEYDSHGTTTAFPGGRPGHSPPR